MRVALVVDAANMFYAQRDQGWHIEYRKVYEYFSREHHLVAAYYITGSPPVENVEEVRKYRRFKAALINMGYTVIDKEVKTITDRETGETSQKCDLDIETCIAILTSMNLWDRIVFFGGDSDFAALFMHLRNCGKEVYCVARKQSTALEIRNVATKFIDLNDLKSEIEKS